MALTITGLGGAATWTTTSGSKTVTATPAVGDLIVLVCAHSGSTSTTATPPTDDNGTGTYALISTAVKVSSADTMTVWVRTALIASAVSTIWTHNPGTTSGGGLAVFKAAGALKWGLGAIVQSGKQDNTAAATPTVTLAAAATTTNALIGAVFNGTNPAGINQRSSPAYAEAVDAGYGTPPSGLEIMRLDSGETSSSIAWASASASEFCAIVVEIDAGAQVVPAMATARGIGRGR